MTTSGGSLIGGERDGRPPALVTGGAGTESHESTGGEIPGTGGSKPSPLTTYALFGLTLTWRQPGGLPECPFFYKWVLDFWGWFSIRLHKWVANDDLRAFHDHPHWFITLVLWGGYTDLHEVPLPGKQPMGTVDVIETDGPLKSHWRADPLGMGSIRFRPASHRHMVRIHRSPTWTLLLCGPHGRRWSFYPLKPGEKPMRRDKYFAEYGHHPCDTGGPQDITALGVRLRPDGSRI